MQVISRSGEENGILVSNKQLTPIITIENLLDLPWLHIAATLATETSESNSFSNLAPIPGPWPSKIQFLRGDSIYQPIIPHELS